MRSDRSGDPGSDPEPPDAPDVASDMGPEAPTAEPAQENADRSDAAATRDATSEATTAATAAAGAATHAYVPPGVHHDLAPEPARAVEPPPPVVPPVVDVDELDWAAVRAAVDPGAVRARMRRTVERMEALLDRDGGPGLLFDADRQHAGDRAIRIAALDEAVPLWFIGDLHGDLLALEAALALARPATATGAAARLVFLGDLFDDGGHGLEVLLRVFELLCDDPGSVCVLAGNHDEALRYDGARFVATVSPSDFADFLNANLAHEWLVRAGKLAVRLFADAPRALFFPDGLLAAHGGVPLADLHAELLATGDWNDPRCLSDFVWTRAHPKARRKMPNRASRGSQFGYEDLAAFCEVAAALGRPVTHMVRGHDHVDERWAVPPAYARHPLLTTNALSRRLSRESFGPYVRVPTVARWTPGALPQVHRLHVPEALVRDCYPEAVEDAGEAAS